MPKPFFLTLEGIDGCGKTTQFELLRTRFEAAGRDVVATREPGGTALAEAIRGYLLHSAQPLDAPAELLLFGAARAQHVAQVIAPALERDSVVLCDRFADSSMAYQGGGLGLDAGFIKAMNVFATCGLEPDLTVLLDIEPALAARRCREQRGGDADRIETRGEAFQCRVRAAYLRLTEASPQRFVVVDASASAQACHQCIVQRLHALRPEFATL